MRVPTLTSTSPSEAAVFWGADPSEHSVTLLVSDVERQRCAALLNVHAGIGRLELDEFDRRLTTVWTARTRGDLLAVMADLPHEGPATGGARAQLVRSLLLRGALVTAAGLGLGGVAWLATGSHAVFWPGWVAVCVALAHIAPSAVRGLGPGGDARGELTRRSARRQLGAAGGRISARRVA